MTTRGMMRGVGDEIMEEIVENTLFIKSKYSRVVSHYLDDLITALCVLE